jgi:hypothetical protein
MGCGRGRDGPCGPPPAQIRTCGLRSIRLLARVIASHLVPSAVRPRCTRLPGPASGEWEEQTALPLRRRLPSIPSAPVCNRFVRELRRYYAAVRLPGCVHRRRTVTPFPTRSVLDCSALADRSMADTARLSRFPRTMRVCMLRSPTPPSVYCSGLNGQLTFAFRALGPRRHSKVARLFRGSILSLHISCQRFTNGITVVHA